MNRPTAAFLLLLAAALCTSTPALAGNILWDDSHDSGDLELTGDYTSFAAAMVAAGHTISELNGSPGAITPAALSGVDAFFLWDAELALTPSEITTLQNFVAAGHGLFVVWDAGTDLPSENTLLAPYGLSLTSDGAAASTVTGFVPHPVTAGVSSISITFGSTVVATGTAIDLTTANGSSNVLAVSATPARVVIFGDSNTFDNTRLGQFNNKQLVVNIANYTAIVPEPATALLLAVGGLLATPRRLRLR